MRRPPMEFPGPLGNPETHKTALMTASARHARGPPPPPLPPTQPASTSTPNAHLHPTPSGYNEPNHFLSYAARDTSQFWNERTSTPQLCTFDEDVETPALTVPWEHSSLDEGIAAESSFADQPNFIGDAGYNPEPMDPARARLVNEYSHNIGGPLYTTPTAEASLTAFAYGVPMTSDQYCAVDSNYLQQAQGLHDHERENRRVSDSNDTSG